MKNVLIIDDDPVLMRMLKLTLRDEGFNVRTARDGQEGLAIAATGEPDVIILDLQMPVMDGRTFYRELRARGIRTPVLILSAYGARRAQRELEADDYLEKPFDPDVLLEKIFQLT